MASIALRVLRLAPIALALILFQRQLVKGLTAGSVTG